MEKIIKKKRKFTKCPVCGVSVNIDNLAEHLRRVHNKTIDGEDIHERAEANPLKVATENGRILNITACEETLEKGARLAASNRFKRAINVLKTIPEEYPDIDTVYMLIGTLYYSIEPS